MFRMQILHKPHQDGYNLSLYNFFRVSFVHADQLSCTPQEQELLDSLVECGQGHLTEQWSNDGGIFDMAMEESSR
jgi:hypothetical protein